MKTLIKILCLSSFLFSYIQREEIISRYENGNKKLLVTYIGSGSSEQVIQRLYYQENGDTLSLESYNENGQKDGKWFFNDGELKGFGYYEDGIRKNGFFIHYLEKYDIKIGAQYKDEKKDGEWTIYFGNPEMIEIVGTPKASGVYKDDKIVKGTFVIWEGEEISSIEYFSDDSTLRGLASYYKGSLQTVQGISDNFTTMTLYMNDGSKWFTSETFNDCCKKRTNHYESANQGLTDKYKYFDINDNEITESEFSILFKEYEKRIESNKE